MTDEQEYVATQVIRAFTLSFQEKLINIALGYRSRALPSTRLHLESAVRRLSRSLGFPDPAKAPNRFLVQPLLDTFKYSDTIVVAILDLWLEARQSLRDEVQAHLGLSPTADARLHFYRAWSRTQMVAAARTLCAQRPNADPDEIALMICCLTEQAPVMEEEADQGDAVTLQVEAQPTSPALNPPPGPQPFASSKAVAEPSAQIALEPLLKELNELARQTHEYLRKGNIALLGDGIASMGEHMHDVLEAWDAKQRYLRARADEAEQKVRQQVPPDDQPDFNDFLRAMHARCETVEEQAQAYKRLNRFNLAWQQYLDRRETAQVTLEQSVSEAQKALTFARDWNIPADSANLQTKVTPEVALRDLERFTRVIQDHQRQWQEQVQQARSQFTAQLLTDCESALAQSGVLLETDTIHNLQARIMNDITDAELRACRVELDAILNRLASAQARLSDLQEPAESYLREPDQTYLELVLEALAKRRRDPVVYVLLNIALHSGVIKPGTEISAAVINAYLNGLLAVTPAEDALAAAIDTLGNSFFVTALHTPDPETRLGLSIFYLSALAARPGCLVSTDLWQLRVDSLPVSAPIWSKLAERVREGHPVRIRRQRDLPADELRTITAWLEDDLRRDGGRFVRSRGRNSIVMTNMEQQHLLPQLEAQWQILRDSKPGQEGWKHACEWLENTDPRKEYESACEEAGVSATESPFFQSAFEERIRRVLDHLNQYVALCKEIAGIQAEHAVMLDDALAELNALAEFIGEPITQLSQLALVDIGEPSEPQPELDIGGASVERRMALRVRRALLGQASLASDLRDAVAWLGENALRKSDGWQSLLRATMQSLALGEQPQSAFEFHLRRNMPEIAALINPTADPVRVNEARNQNRSLVQTQVADLKRRKRELLSEEQEWFREGRWTLLLNSLSERLEIIRAEENRQEQEDRATLRQLMIRVQALETRVADATYLPQRTADELFSALDEVRVVGRRGLTKCVFQARLVLQEIDHLLDYESANSESVLHVLEELKNASLSRPNFDATEISSSPLSNIIQALRDGQYEILGLSSNTYADAGWQDRLDLLLLWQKLSGLAAEPTQLTPDQIEELRSLTEFFAKVTFMYYGQSGRSTQRVTHYFSRDPVPHYETELKKPRVAALRAKNIVLLVITELQIHPRRLRELDHAIEEQGWLRTGGFVVILANGDPAPVHDWARRRYVGKSLVVIDEASLRQVIFADNNPTSIGRFRWLLLLAAGPNIAEVFRYQNYVDSEHEIFVGRSDWLRRLVHGNQTYAIYGGRRVGKTSLLKAAERELQANGVNAIYKSFEGVSADFGGLSVAQSIVRELGLDKPCESLPAFKQIINDYFAQHPDHTIVILLDELDAYIGKRHDLGEPHELIEICRNLFQEHRRNIRFVFAGFIELWKHLHNEGDYGGRSSPYSNFIEDPGPLPGLPDDEARKIVQVGFQEELGVRLVSSNIPLKIVEATAGHPAFVQKFCERLHDRLHVRRTNEIHLSDVDAVREDPDARAYIRFVVETLDLNLNKLSQILVYLLTVDRKDQFTATDVYNLAKSYGLETVSVEAVDESCRELLITSVFKSNAPGQYRFSVPAYPAILSQLEMADRTHLERLINLYQQRARA